MENSVASSATNEGNSFSVTNPISAPSLKVESQADYSPYDTPGSNYNDHGNHNSINFNPSLAILIVGLFTFIFLTVVFFVCVCRTFGVETGSRPFRPPGPNNNMRGLERTVIESFPVFTYSLVKGLNSQPNGSECTVCLSDFADDEMVRLLPKCNHAFHPECIDMWLSSHTTCPVCRISLVPAEDSTTTATEEPRTTPEQVTIVVDKENNEARESMGQALLVVRKEMEQPTEWCISTTRGLIPGLQRSCSFVGGHHSKAASTSNAQPSCSKTGGSVDDGRRGSKSERWGIGSKNPSSILRSFSERVAAPPGERRGMEQTNNKAYLTRTFSWLIMGRESERNRAEGLENTSVSSRDHQIAV